MEVLIYGCRKSGTTLFQRLLDGTQEIFVHPSETKIKNYIKLKEKANGLVDFSSLKIDDVYPFLFKAANKNWAEVNEEVYLDWIKNHYKDVQSLKDFINLDIEASRQSMGKISGKNLNWAIKEVSGNTSEIFQSFLTAFPKGRIITIYRDPRHIASAIYREKKRSGTKMSLRLKSKISIHPYKITGEMNDFNYSQIYRIDYEHLVTSTAEVMGRVANFLDTTYSDVLTEPTINGNICKVPSSSKDQENVFNRKRTLTDNINIIEFLLIHYNSFRNREIISDCQKMFHNPFNRKC